MKNLSSFKQELVDRELNKKVNHENEMSNNNGDPLRYSEKQTDEAVENEPERNISKFYFETVFPAVNNALYPIVGFITIIYIIISFAFANNYPIIADAAALISFLLIAVIAYIIEKKYQKHYDDWEKQPEDQVEYNVPWKKRLSNFSVSTSMYFYCLTPIACISSACKTLFIIKIVLAVVFILFIALEFYRYVIKGK